jgi:hypothetical protein
MHIRQIALVARDLAPGLAALRDVFDLPEPFPDPGVGEFGLVNGVFSVGTGAASGFLEVVSPVREDATAARYLARRGGDSGYMVILQTSDLALDRARLEGLGVRIVWRVTLPDIATLHLHPRDLPGAIVSIDQPVPAESWRWGGPGWEAKRPSALVSEIVGAEVQTADPEKLAMRWAEVLGLAVPREDGEGFRLALERDHALRFVPIGDARGEGLVAVSLRVRDAAEIRRRAGARGALAPDGSVALGGVRFRLV